MRTLGTRALVAVAALAALGLAGAGPVGVAAARASEPAPPGPVTAYVVNSNGDTVTPIKTATNTAGPAIAVQIAPWFIVITPDGKTAYVANTYSGTVTPIRTATGKAGPPIPVGGDPSYLGGIALRRNGETADGAVTI